MSPKRTTYHPVMGVDFSFNADSLESVKDEIFESVFGEDLVINAKITHVATAVEYDTFKDLLEIKPSTSSVDKK